MKPDNWHVVFTGYVVLTEEVIGVREQITTWLASIEANGRHWTQAAHLLWFEHFDDAAEFYMRFKN